MTTSVLSAAMFSMMAYVLPNDAGVHVLSALRRNLLSELGSAASSEGDDDDDDVLGSDPTDDDDEDELGPKQSDDEKTLIMGEEG